MEKYPINLLIKYVKESNSIIEVLKKFSIKNSHANRSYFRTKIKKNNIDMSHFNDLFIPKPDHTLKKLLEETPISYYIMGFYMADGTSGLDDLFEITLNVKDVKLLEIIGNIINRKVIGPYVNNKGNFISRITVGDKDLVPEIFKKFDIKYRKTINPPIELNIFNDDLFLSFLIGFIDGDGYISTKKNRIKASNTIVIQLYHTWKLVISNWINRLYKLAEIECLGGYYKSENNAKINKRGYASITIGNSKVVSFLKSKILELNIPALNRKWDKVSLDYSNRRIESNILKTNVLNDLKNGEKNKDLAKKYKVDSSNISHIKSTYLKENII